MILYRNPQLFVKQSPEPRFGVYTNSFLKRGSIIEQCHFVTIGDGLNNDNLRGYAYNYESPSGVSKQIIPLGYGAIYNHNDNHNAEWFVDYEKELMVFVTTKNIFKGEQIYINYGPDYSESLNNNSIF